MIIIGFDLSLSDSGWAVMEIIDKDNYSIIEKGHIPTHLNRGGRRYSTGSRLNKIDQKIRRLLEKYPEGLIVKESSFSNGNNKSTQQIFKVNGIFELIVHQSDAKVFKEYAPSTIKKNITGNGHADKKDVAKLVYKWTGIKTKNDNITDAIAVAFTHAIREKFIVIQSDDLE